MKYLGDIYHSILDFSLFTRIKGNHFVLVDCVIVSTVKLFEKTIHYYVQVRMTTAREKRKINFE